ncbi:MAG: DUF4864 domain-containing protein [Actinomycetota bacterium]|jgi:hypothetical protein
MRVVLPLLAAALLSACVTGSATGGQEGTQTPAQTPTPIPTQTQEPSTTPSPSNPSPSSEPAPSQSEQPEQTPTQTPSQTPRQPDVQVAECTQETFDATRQTIEGQQEAFATGDFATARTFSSQSFQSYVSVEQFQEIIVGTYPFLIDSPELAFPECQRETDTVLMRVEVDGSPSVIMIYRLVLEGDGWFIDGASIAGTREDVDV